MTRWLRLTDAPPPPAAVEIAANRVSAATLELRGGQPVVAQFGTEPLPEGALVPSLTAPNARDRATVVGALGRVLDRIGRPKRVGIILPDPVAKVSLIRFEHVPARQQDLEQLVRWQMRKTAPFAIDDAQVSFVPGLQTTEGREFVVSLARRDIVREYEGLCEEVGTYAGLVDLATFNIINAVLASSGPPAHDWLVVNVTAEYASLAILRGDAVIFFRNRGSDTDGTLPDLVHQASMYYEDRLAGHGLTRVVLAGVAAGGAEPGYIEEARRSLEERLGKRVDVVDPRTAAALTDRISAGSALLDTLAPLVGLLLRGQDAHVAQ